MWGAVPLFWPLVKRASALELLAHRVLWSLVVCVILLITVVPRGWWSRIGHRRSLIMLGGAAAVVSVNWGIYIWAVNHGHVVETSLGYYINPILSILVGVILLRERLVPVQWASVGLAAAAVVVLTIDYGRLPWIALTLATSFATYGLLKKRVNGGAVETMTVESALLTPIALGYLIYLQSAGTLTFGHLGWSHNLLLMATGLVTVVPLLFFSSATTRLPLSTLGLLQYLAPTLQFLLGVLYFGETMSLGRWIGFGLVWIALVILTAYGLHRARRPPHQSARTCPRSGSAGSSRSGARPRAPALALHLLADDLRRTREAAAIGHRLLEVVAVHVRPAPSSVKPSTSTKVLSSSTLRDHSKKRLPGSARVDRVKLSTRSSQRSLQSGLTGNLTTMTYMLTSLSTSPGRPLLLDWAGIVSRKSALAGVGAPGGERGGLDDRQAMA